jgi:hypothetical protein
MAKVEAFAKQSRLGVHCRTCREKLEAKVALGRPESEDYLASEHTEPLEAARLVVKNRAEVAVDIFWCDNFGECITV